MNQLVLGLPLTALGFLIPGLPLLGALVNGTIAWVCRGGRYPVPKLLVGLVAVGLYDHPGVELEIGGDARAPLRFRFALDPARPAAPRSLAYQGTQPTKGVVSWQPR